MSSQNHTDGGVQAKRGFTFQAYGLLFYMLIRRLEFPNLEVIVEPDEGEDAKFLYSVKEGDQHNEVIELIQYKKREASDSSGVNLTDTEIEEWKEGVITPHRLKKWVQTKRARVSVVDLLEASDNICYTAVIFGNITKGVARFIPKDLPKISGFRSYRDEFSTAFPFNYKHEFDPLPPSNNKTFSTKNVRQRIRVLRFGSPHFIEVQCRMILENFYDTSRHRSSELVDRLCIEIGRREIAKAEIDRHFSPSDIETIIATGKSGQGRWLEAQLLLQLQSLTKADINNGELPNWDDFENARYAYSEDFEGAWEGLKRDGFIVVCGAAGTGKTTLCRYLAFKFLKAYQVGTSYYLRPEPNHLLDEEIEFLKQRTQTDALFIIDDQHLAPDEVEILVQTFTDYRSLARSRARLVCTSTLTYGRSTMRGKRKSELSRALQIHLQPASPSKMIRILSTLRLQAGLSTPLTNDEIASLSQGNLGLGLMLARCAEDLKDSSPLSRLFGSSALRKTLMNWVLMHLGRDDDTVFFELEIVPVFTLGTQEVPIPNDFTRAVEELLKAGFLEVDQSNPDGKTLRTTSRRLAMLIRIQHQRQEFLAWSSYLMQYPKQLPTLSERLANDDRGRTALRKLLKEYFDYFLEQLNDSYEPMSLMGISKILHSVNLAVPREESSRLLREFLAPSGQPRGRVFANLLRTERVGSVTELTLFFRTVHKIDRFLVRRLAETHLGDSQTNYILSLFEKNHTSLDEISQCIEAIRKCSQEFATNLYQRLKNSPVFREKIEQANADPRNLFIWLRFCENLKTINRDDSKSFLSEYLSPTTILNAITQSSEFYQMGTFLIRFRRLNPKLAADIASDLSRNHTEKLEQLIRNEADVITLSNDLYVLSRLNRRSALNIAHKLKEEIFDRIQAEEHYNNAISTIDTFRRSLSLKVAQSAAQAIDPDRMLEEFKQEQQRFSLVGRSIYNLAQVSPNLAKWFVERLDYRIYTRRIQTRLIYHYTHLLRGFLTAASSNADHKSDLLNQLLSDSTLIGELNKAWEEASNLTEIAFFLSQLLAVPVSRTAAIHLLGFANPPEFRKKILEKFKRENSIFHLTNGLFAVAKFDLNLALEALRLCVDRITEEPHALHHNEKPQSTRQRSSYRPKLPRGYEANDLVEMGCLLRIASAIETAQALWLVGRLDLRKFASYGAYEANLGRLAVFIQGLHETSRLFAREFIEITAVEEFWHKQLQENEVLENAVHYARSLGHVSAAKGSRFTVFMVEHYKNDIYTSLEAEANLMLVSNWLRLLSRCPKEFIQEQVAEISSFLISTADYDTRLRQLLEATDALMECGEDALAREFAMKALDQSYQIRSVRRLQDWIVLFHKGLRIERSLNLADFTSHLFSATKVWHFLASTLGFETEPLLVAYTYRLFDSLKINGFDEFQRGVLDRHSQIMNSIRREPCNARKVIALILAKAPVEEIKLASVSAEWHECCERGLAAILFSGLFPGDENPLTSDCSTDERESILQELNEHKGNLEFALTLHLAAMMGLQNELLERYRDEAFERASDEMISATRWLLQQELGSVRLDGGHYSIWLYIKQTLLRSAYLTWEDDLEEAANSSTFELVHFRHLDSILT